MSALLDLHAAGVAWVFETLLQPALYALGLMDWAEDAFDWLDFALFGLMQVAVIYAVCRPLEAWWPVEAGPRGRPVRTDVLYTLLTRLGLLPLLAFVALAGPAEWFAGWLVERGLEAPTLEGLVPWLRDRPLAAFAAYVAVLDLGEYWRHRLQHRLPWWWALHSLHHAQTRMTFWTDDRNHVLDDVLGAVWFGGLALLIGVPPAQFPLVVLLLRLGESLSHANARLSFGRVGERLLVSPRFHRQHHGVLSAGQAGCNFAVLLPVWDWVFGTADFGRRDFPATGDPEAPAALVRGGWLRQQWVGLRQVAAVLRGRAAPPAGGRPPDRAGGLPESGPQSPVNTSR